MTQLNETLKTVCSVKILQNDDYVDWGDYPCLLYYDKEANVQWAEVCSEDYKPSTNDRIVIGRTCYNIIENIENKLKIAKNDIESSIMGMEDMGVPIEYGTRVPVSCPLAPEDEHFVNQWVGVWTRNVAKNYNRICQGETISILKNRALDAPAVIVGAGPSLDKNIDALKDINAVVISTDRAYKALLARDIHPDIIVSVDCHDDHILNYLNRVDSTDHILAINSAADYKIARMWQGRVLYFNMAHKGMQFCERVLPYLFKGFPAVANVGCVANTALIIASWIGCSKMILVGCDFSYPDKKVACDSYDLINGAMQKVEIDWAERFEKRSGKVRVKEIYTYPPFLDYIETMKELGKDHKFSIINATEGGIIDCFPCMSLQEAKNTYCEKDINNLRSNLKRR